MLLDDDIIFCVTENDNGEKETLEAYGAEMTSIERVTSEAGKVFGRGIILEEAAASGGVVKREEGGTGDDSNDVSVRPGLDPTEVLDP